MAVDIEQLGCMSDLLEGYGVYFDGNTYFINASACGLNYTPLRSAIIVDLPLDRRRPVLVGEVLDEDNQVRNVETCS